MLGDGGEDEDFANMVCLQVAIAGPQSPKLPYGSCLLGPPPCGCSPTPALTLRYKMETLLWFPVMSSWGWKVTLEGQHIPAIVTSHLCRFPLNFIWLHLFPLLY